MKHLLMIAYHFPPLAGGSGIQRCLRFVQHLPEFGWQPTVLSVHPRAYESHRNPADGELPSGLQVIRAPAWDSARHLAICGRYPRLLALPDRWASWWPGGTMAGLNAIRRECPDALWSTYPIATAHRIAHTLAKHSGLPWIADFRDPMAHDGYPTDPIQWRSFLRVEQAAIRRASFSTFTAPGAARFYQQRYPECAERMRVLENGYADSAFPSEPDSGPLNPGKLTLLHSGIVYPSERDPTHLMQALAQLKQTSPESFARLRIRFRAPVHGDLLHALAEANNVATAIEILPPLHYSDALAEMLAADALLLMQATNCNLQIPAKFYEYLACRRPILTLTDPHGDTAEAVRAAGVDAIAPLDNPEAIALLLNRFIASPASIPRPTETAVAGASRRARTAQLANLLDSLVPSRVSFAADNAHHCGRLSIARAPTAQPQIPLVERGSHQEPIAPLGERGWREAVKAATTLSLPEVVPKPPAFQQGHLDSPEAARAATTGRGIDPHLTRDWFDLLERTALPPGVAVSRIPVGSAVKPESCLLPMMRQPQTPWLLESLATFYSPLFGPIDETNLDTGELQQAFVRLRQDRARPTARIHLSPLCPESRFFATATQALVASGWIVSTYFRFGNWFTPVLRPDFAAYLAERPAVLRHTIARARRKLERRPDYTLRIHTEPGPALEAAIIDYLDVYAKSWKSPEPYPDFIPTFCRLAAARGWLRLGIIRLDRHAVASQIWLVEQGRAQIVKLAYDSAYRKTSVGTVLTAALMQHVIEQNRVGEIDYLMGDDAYKRDWTPNRRERCGIVAFNPTRLKGLSQAARHFSGRFLKPSR